jgi:hypothetical protein
MNSKRIAVLLELIFILCKCQQQNVSIPLEMATATYSYYYFPISGAIDESGSRFPYPTVALAETGWNNFAGVGQSQQAVFYVDHSYFRISSAQNVTLIFLLSFPTTTFTSYRIGKFRLSFTTEARCVVEELGLNIDSMWQPIALSDVTASDNTTFEFSDDLTVFVTLPLSMSTSTAFAAVGSAASLSSITALRLEALTDARLPRGGPGTSAEGTFILTTFSVRAIGTNLSVEKKPFTLQTPISVAQFQQLEFDSATATVANAAWNYTKLLEMTTLEHVDTHGWHIPRESQTSGATLRLFRKSLRDTTSSSHTLLRIRCLFGQRDTLSGNFQQQFGRLRISVTNDADNRLSWIATDVVNVTSTNSNVRFVEMCDKSLFRK